MAFSRSSSHRATGFLTSSSSAPKYSAPCRRGSIAFCRARFISGSHGAEPGDMTLAELRQRWEYRRDEWSRFGASVDGAKLAGEIVADLEALAASRDAELLTPRQAAAASGYH